MHGNRTIGEINETENDEKEETMNIYPVPRDKKTLGIN